MKIINHHERAMSSKFISRPLNITRLNNITHYNKKAVIRVLEAITAILLLLGVVLTLMARQPSKVDFSSSAYQIENQVLNEIAQDNSLRTAVINNNTIVIECYIQQRLAKYFLDFNISFANPPSNYVPCIAPFGKEVYTSDIIVSTNITDRNFSPQKLMLCAWSGQMTNRDVAGALPSCYDNDVYTMSSCGTTKTKITECGNEITYGAFGAKYCKNDDVYYSRTKTTPGCANGACAPVESIEEQLFKDCALPAKCDSATSDCNIACAPTWTVWSKCQSIGGVWQQTRNDGCGITESRGTAANLVAKTVDGCIKTGGCLCASTELGAAGGCTDGFDNDGNNVPDDC